MKLALLVYTSPDARAGEPAHSVLRPFDQVLGEFKSYVEFGKLPDDAVAKGYTNLEIWTQSGGRVKRHHFPLPVAQTESPVDPAPEGDESPTEIQPAAVSGLSPSEPGEATPQAEEDSAEETPDTTEVDSATPKGGGKKTSGKAS